MIAPLALVADAILGEPSWLWSRIAHPIELIGKLISLGDERLNRGRHKRLKGIALIAILIIGALITGILIEAVPGYIADVIVAAVLIAHKSLFQHVRAVGDALSVNLEQARSEVAKIVGRDTSALDETGVTRAALESAAENFSDGVIAPLFWLLVAGLPGIIAYKVLNTADSMIGYRNDKYREFGWAAARLDDVANFVPARLAAALFLLAGNKAGAWRQVVSDAPKHRSVNAGWPEAAYAQVLDVALAGPRSYDGELRDFPYVNETGEHDLGSAHITNGVALLWKAWGVALLVTVAISFIA